MDAPISPEMISSIDLADGDGTTTTLGEFRADPLVVILVRYFGCLPCQDYLRELDHARGRFPSASRIIAVGGSADHQARWLRDAKGVTLPLLLDPEHRVRGVAALGDLTPRQFSSPGGAGSYVRSFLRGFRPQAPTVDVMKAPGIAIFDPGFSVAWVHRGESLGDYPAIGDLVDTVESLVTSG